MYMYHRVILTIFTMLVAAFLFTGCDDRVTFSNPNASGEIGILLDGVVGGSAQNDKSHTTAANGLVSAGDVTAGAHNEIIAFQTRRAVTLKENVGWTNNDDTVNVALTNRLGTKFYVWILETPYADMYNKAIAACIKLDQIWAAERSGLYVSTFSVTDSTADPDRAPFLDFTCAEAASLRNNIGYNNNGVNVYYVDRVNFGSGFSTGNGVWCGTNTIVMGRNTSDHLAAHEAGHAFALGHVNSLITNFDQTNVMHNASNTREFLTEGQNFRAHLDPDSVINTTYNLRPGLTTRNCAPVSETATNECPAVQKRIWADGTFPAN